MLGTIIKPIRTAALIGVIGSIGFLGYEYHRTRDAAHVVDTVKITAETSAHWTAEQTDEARKAWQKLNVERKVDDLQDKARPVGRKISSVVGHTIGPSLKPVEAGERRMSGPAMILIFVFGAVFLLLGKFSSHGRY